MFTSRTRLGRWRLELLERRDQPAVWTVNTTADSGAGSLRDALIQAGAAGSDTIQFQIPGTGPFTIQPLTALPPVPDATVIDATGQAGWAPGAPVVELSGVSAGAGSTGLTIASNSVTIRGLVINRFDGFGLHVNDGSNVVIAGCFIGVDQSGTALAENKGAAVSITGTPGKNTNVLLGGPGAADRNVIADGGIDTVLVAKVGGSVIRNNVIGLDKTANVDLSSGTAANLGISLESSVGATTIRDNVISGANYAGIFGFQTTAAIAIAGNTIGLNGAGTAAVANFSYGIQLIECKNATIGGTAAADRNIISGNGHTTFGAGIDLRNCSAITITGNYLGTDASGATAVANTPYGINVNNASSAITIGGATAGAGNVISGNGSSFLGAGINVDNSNLVTIAGNFIGVNAAGTAALGNISFGMWLKNGAKNNTIGGTTPGARNVIDGNGSVVNGYGAGIRIQDELTADNSVLGNWIGLRPDGTGVLPNLFHGIDLEAVGAGNIIGGVAAGAGNLIIGNGVTAGVGVRISGNKVAVIGNTIGGNKDDGLFLEAANDATISRNLIGFAADGTTKLANGKNGILINAGTGSTIGGPTAGNIIAFNGGSGVVIINNGIDHSIRGNAIFANAKFAIDLEDDGPSLNDTNDFDSGANLRTNYPVVDTATGGSTTTVSGTYHGVALGQFDFDFYALPAAPGQGMRHLGSTTITTDALGNATYSAGGLLKTFGGELVVVSATDSFGNTSELSPPTVISGPTKPPAQVAAVKIDDGTAQRSLVRSLTITFDQQLDFGLAADAFGLSRQGGGAVNLAAQFDNFGPTTVVTLRFTGGEVEGISLKNGRYNFTIDAGKITTAGGTVSLDGNGDGTAGDNYVLNSATTGSPTNIWRLFGDVDGDNDVDSTDFGQFRLAFGGGGSLFDVDNDGDTDTSDFGRFRTSFGVSI